MALISDHFINNIKRNILKLLFSFAIFGNPRKLVSTISKGLYDFKTMPMQGDGVGGFIVGSAKGTVSLLKNAFEGTFGVVESFTGGFSKLCLVFNQDEDYLGSREEKIITEKPRNLVEGVGFGCQTAIESVIAASTGLVTRPYIEARRNGFKGFLQGLYSGTTGLVLKPISGGLDLISKSAEGIKNTVKIFEA
jgi:vacuolar protein sorting-associated protein 13A/C